MATLKRELTDAVGALPSALNPLALSLNENPFPPLPAVRSALIESIDAANRYPEYLPERLRSLIAGRVGVRDEQVVIGAGATGVILQVLHAVTSPGDKMVMTSPTFDGYPIFAQMARLESVTRGAGCARPSRPRRHGRRGGATPGWSWCAGRTTRPAPSSPPPTSSASCGGFRPTPWCCSTRPTSSSCRRELPDRRARTRRAVSRMSWCCAPSRRPTGWPGCGSATASALRIWPAGCGRCSRRSASVSPAWWRSRPHMTRKANCGNVFG